MHKITSIVDNKEQLSVELTKIWWFGLRQKSQICTIVRKKKERAEFTENLHIIRQTISLWMQNAFHFSKEQGGNITSQPMKLELLNSKIKKLLVVQPPQAIKLNSVKFPFRGASKDPRSGKPTNPHFWGLKPPDFRTRRWIEASIR